MVFRIMFYPSRINCSAFIEGTVILGNSNQNQNQIRKHPIHTLEETPDLKVAVVSTKRSRVMVWRFQMRAISNQDSISWYKMEVVIKAHIHIIRRQLMLIWVQDLFKCTHTTWLASNNFLKAPLAKAFQENSDSKAERNQEVERI